MERVPTHAVRGNSVILYQDFQSFPLISMLMGASSSEKKEPDLSQLVLASVRSKEQAGSSGSQLGLPVLTHSCVLPLLSSPECATKCFLSHTS